MILDLSYDGRVPHARQETPTESNAAALFHSGKSTLNSTGNTHWTHERIRQTQRHDTARGLLLVLVGYLQLHELLAVVRDLVSRLVELRGRRLGLSLPLVALRLRLGELGLCGRLRSNPMRAQKQ
jgi:hypothetical protein